MASEAQKKLETFTNKPSEIAVQLKEMLPTGVAVFLWGPPGLGKSSIVKQVADDLGMEFIDLRLSQLDPTDLRGIPYPTKEPQPDGTVIEGMRWSAPLVLPRDKNARAIICLDEFNSAALTVQAASYQLVLDRKLGEYTVPEGCYIVACGNRETDKGITFKMPTPIANRFAHIEMRKDFDDWQTWAVRTRQNADVVAYLSQFKDHLFQFSPSTAARGFATPRSWEFVSRLLNRNPDLDTACLTGLIAGCVGDGITAQFLEFREHVRDLPDINLILNGKLKTMPDTAKKYDVSLQYALTIALCYELKERADDLIRRGKPEGEYDKWLGEADNFIEFMMANFAQEISIMAAKAAMVIHRLPFSMPKQKHLKAFAHKYKSLILT